MDKLEALASITRLSDRVVRVLGQNPGKFTLQGTNTYIIGRQNPYTLVDTGEGKPAYLPLLSSALRDTACPLNPAEPDVSDIILSHRHVDHVGGLKGVLELLRELWHDRNQGKDGMTFRPPRIHKFPLPPTAPDTVLQETIDSLLAGSYTPSPTGMPFHDLHDDQILELSDADSGSLRVLHTPGHTSDSIALYVSADRALYTADTVLGQGTASFGDLAALIASLRKMLAFGATIEGGGGYACLYPGHGPVVADGAGLISTYIAHRLEREMQIVQVLQSPSPASLKGNEWTTWDIMASIYAEYPESLWVPAARGVDLHLKKLEKDGRVKRGAGECNDVQWVLIDSK